MNRMGNILEIKDGSFDIADGGVGLTMSLIPNIGSLVGILEISGVGSIMGVRAGSVGMIFNTMVGIGVIVGLGVGVGVLVAVGMVVGDGVLVGKGVKVGKGAEVLVGIGVLVGVFVGNTVGTQVLFDRGFASYLPSVYVNVSIRVPR